MSIKSKKRDWQSEQSIEAMKYTLVRWKNSY